MTARRILVTGATGFLGGHLVRELSSANVVRAAVRRATDVPSAGEIAIVPDLLDRNQIRTALKDVQVVVHAAGRAHVLRERAHDPMSEFRRVNVDVTAALADAARAAHVERFILLSSISVFGPGQARIDGLTAPAPATPYGISKLEGEEAVRASGIDAVILRLPLVHGPGMKGNPLLLFQLVQKRLPIPVSTAANARSLLFVGNLVAAVGALLDSPAAAGRTFLVADDRPVSTAELVHLIAQGLGRPARLFPLSMTLFRAMGRAGDVIARMVPCPMNSAVVGRLTDSLVVDATELTTRIGFAAPYTVEQGLARTAAWYRERWEKPK